MNGDLWEEVLNLEMNIEDSLNIDQIVSTALPESKSLELVPHNCSCNFTESVPFSFPRKLTKIPPLMGTSSNPEGGSFMPKKVTTLEFWRGFKYKWRRIALKAERQKGTSEGSLGCIVYCS
ncbi:hypothetical protein LWI28_010574 [Acer negundo]|uniref:Uncharacterized protein n=1 Tax=Acer negundo TaxID=4023 RepID=A0AAD5JPW6_ACENE|nr:hypothetical protein LWI28_010574 [Acer negundo]